MIKVIANRKSGYVEAYLGDCVHLTFTKTIHSPVRTQISDTVTTRAGELGVVIHTRD